MEIEKVERGGKPLQATGVHERIMELLTSVGAPRIHGSVTPRKIVERVKLGESLGEGEPVIAGIRVADVLESFFRDIAPPRLESAAVLRKGIARGVSEGCFAYTSGGTPALGADGRFQVSRDRVIQGKPIAEDEVDFDSGFLMVPAAVPEAPAVQPSGTVPVETGSVIPPGVDQPSTGVGAGPGAGPATTGQEAAGRKNRIAMTFEATREQVFKAFPAIANLADKSDGAKVKITIEGSSANGYDPSWLRNAVDEPLEEADIEKVLDD
jgi:hypothetical protein